jgi:hypothetical protein
MAGVLRFGRRRRAGRLNKSRGMFRCPSNSYISQLQPVTAVSFLDFRLHTHHQTWLVEQTKPLGLDQDPHPPSKMIKQIFKATNSANPPLLPLKMTAPGSHHQPPERTSPTPATLPSAASSTGIGIETRTGTAAQNATEPAISVGIATLASTAPRGLSASRRFERSAAWVPELSGRWPK